MSSAAINRPLNEIPMRTLDRPAASIELRKADDGTVYLADPMNPNPLKSQYYSVTFDRLLNSIMLGIVTYDANLLIIEPK